MKRYDKGWKKWITVFKRHSVVYVVAIACAVIGYGNRTEFLKKDTTIDPSFEGVTEQKIEEGMDETGEKSTEEKLYDQSVSEEEQKKITETVYKVSADIKDTYQDKNEEALSGISQLQAGYKTKFLLYEVSKSSDTFVVLYFESDGTKVDVVTANVIGEDSPVITYSSKCRIEEWKYTQKGWFLFKRAEPEEGQEGYNSTDMVRILPLSEEANEMCEKYILPIGYQGNNLFLIDWKQGQEEKIDFTGLYEYLYRMDYGSKIDVEASYEGIGEEEFEQVIKNHIEIDSTELKKIAKYDETLCRYPWRKLGCSNYHPNQWGNPTPEVVKITHLPENKVRLTVDAVWDEHYTDAAFTHEVTLQIKEDGTAYYLANQIIPSEDNIIPQYEYRIGEEK